MRLGVCYYPEHWDPSVWRDDARRMAELGIAQVRIGEFAWSRIEPEPGRFDWGWLDRALDTLGAAELEVMLGTPTATPPKWLVDRHPEILPWDAKGRPRGFGSRRHTCFSSPVWRRETARIVTALAERYGRHPALTCWQTDNEYGCHDTVISYSPAAAEAFRNWLAARHCGVSALNEAWGTVFWSQEYRSFDEIDPPAGMVTEANPAHVLDWKRFSSDQVVSYNRLQVDILRAHSPGRDILHNMMGMFTAYDHFKVGADLDLVGWDSYPLGFLDMGWASNAHKARFARQGDPDFTAFHHALYRTAGRGRWQISEQQPGPVNWARWNPAPLPGMVRAWTWEAFAQGAETVAYFRWRQAPFAQEQMHAGLLRPDGVEAPAAAEARQVACEIPLIGDIGPRAAAPVALVFDYEGLWSTETQPQGADFRPLELILDFYAAARRCGLEVDVVPPDADLTGRKLILAPHLPIWPEGLTGQIDVSGAAVVVGPRAGSKSPSHRVPDGLPPHGLKSLINLLVERVESLRPGLEHKAGNHVVRRWLEHIETAIAPNLATDEGHGLWFVQGKVHYLSAWPDHALLALVIRQAAREAGLATVSLPDGLRIVRRAGVSFAINHAPEPVSLAEHLPECRNALYLFGSGELGPAGVAAWRTN
jgi:beta-galactosidase